MPTPQGRFQHPAPLVARREPGLPWEAASPSLMVGCDKIKPVPRGARSCNPTAATPPGFSQQICGAGPHQAQKASPRGAGGVAGTATPAHPPLLSESQLLSAFLCPCGHAEATLSMCCCSLPCSYIRLPEQLPLPAVLPELHLADRLRGGLPNPLLRVSPLPWVGKTALKWCRSPE